MEVAEPAERAAPLLVLDGMPVLPEGAAHVTDYDTNAANLSGKVAKSEITRNNVGEQPPTHDNHPSPPHRTRIISPGVLTFRYGDIYLHTGNQR